MRKGSIERVGRHGFLSWPFVSLRRRLNRGIRRFWGRLCSVILEVAEVLLTGHDEEGAMRVSATDSSDTHFDSHLTFPTSSQS